MNAYFYQDWQSEYSGMRVDDTNVLILFAQNENLEIVTNLVTDIKYILSNDLAKQIFDTNNFDFNPLLYGYSVSIRPSPIAMASRDEVTTHLDPLE